MRVDWRKGPALEIRVFFRVIATRKSKRLRGIFQLVKQSSNSYLSVAASADLFHHEVVGALYRGSIHYFVNLLTCGGHSRREGQNFGAVGSQDENFLTIVS